MQREMPPPLPKTEHDLAQWVRLCASSVGGSAVQTRQDCFILRDSIGHDRLCVTLANGRISAGYHGNEHPFVVNSLEELEHTMRMAQAAPLFHAGGGAPPHFSSQDSLRSVQVARHNQFPGPHPYGLPGAAAAHPWPSTGSAFVPYQQPPPWMPPGAWMEDDA